MDYSEMKQKINDLEAEIKRLEDENSSLWFLLDEFEKSNISNPEYREMFTKVYDKLRYQTLMTVTADGEA
jgi:DNA repair ATPase RecN